MEKNDLRRVLALAIGMIGEPDKSRDDFYHQVQQLGIDAKTLDEAARVFGKADQDFEKLERDGIGQTELSMIVLTAFLEGHGEVSQAVYIPKDDPFGINELVLHTADSMDWEYRVSRPAKRVKVKLTATANCNLGEWDNGTFNSLAEESGCHNCKGYLDEDIESVDLKEEEITYKPQSLHDALHTIENWMEAYARFGFTFEVL